MRDKILAPIPWPIRVVVGNIVYNKNIRTFQGQGAGKFTAEELKEFRSEIWETISEALKVSHAQHSGEGPFWVWGGETPTDADAVVFGFVVSNLMCEA